MRRVVVLLGAVALTFAGHAAGDRPAEFPIFSVFEDVNPCTGNPMTVTFTGTVARHEHGSRLVVHSARTITTSDGFAGHGTDTFVQNSNVFTYSQTDIMTNAATGERFRVRITVVGDFSTDPPRVEKVQFICLTR